MVNCFEVEKTKQNNLFYLLKFDFISFSNFSKLFIMFFSELKINVQKEKVDKIKNIAHLYIICNCCE